MFQLTVAQWRQMVPQVLINIGLTTPNNYSTNESVRSTWCVYVHTHFLTKTFSILIITCILGHLFSNGINFFKGQWIDMIFFRSWLRWWVSDMNNTVWWKLYLWNRSLMSIVGSCYSNVRAAFPNSRYKFFVGKKIRIIHTGLIIHKRVE